MKERNDSHTFTLSREELYEQVWTTSITRLSPQFGLSDVGLANVCKKHSIPRPPRGHWARLKHGKCSPKTPLPKLLDDALETIVFDQRRIELSSQRIEGGMTPPEARCAVTVSPTLGKPRGECTGPLERLSSSVV